MLCYEANVSFTCNLSALTLSNLLPSFFVLKFNPTNHMYVRAPTEKRHAFRAIYTVQSIYDFQIRWKEGRIVKNRSI
jgi:hypothetical protein